MKNLKESNNWLHHITPLTISLIALIIVVLAPFWAINWAQIPFLGIFLEPHNIVSALDGDDWSAKNAGVQSYDRLISINGENTLTASEVGEVLARTGFTPTEIELITRQGDVYQVVVTPRQFKVGEIVNWFGVPYAVGLAFLGIGLWAYRMSKEQRPARAFLTFTAAFSITTVAYFDMNTTQHFVLGWALSTPIAAGALANLALVFPRPMNFVQNRPILRFLPWLVTFLLAIPVTREIIMPSNPWAYINTWFGSYAFSAVAIVIFLGSLLFRIFRDQSAMIRQQSRLIVFGAALAFGPVLFLFLLPSVLGQLVRFPMAIVFPAMTVLPLSVAYSIVRYRMLDVDRLLGSTLSYVITASGAVLLYYLVLALLSLLIPDEMAPNDPLMIALFLFFI